MLNESIGIMVQIMLATLGAIRACEIFWAGFKHLYKGRSLPWRNSTRSTSSNVLSAN